MRHLGTLIAAIVIAPAAWLLLAFGQTDAITSFAHATTSGAWPAGDFIAPLLTLTGAGLLLGLIGTLRFSPLGAVITGLVYTASFVVLLFAGRSVNDLLNHTVTISGHQAELRTPVGTGTTLLLGVLLLVSAVSVKRWRRWPAAASATVPAGTEPAGDGTTEDTKPFWPSPTPAPVSSSLGAFGGDESPTERQFGSPWRTPPANGTADDAAR